MILVDFSNLSMRCMFISVLQSKKNGYANNFNNGKLDLSCYKNFFLHLLFSNLSSIKKEFTKDYGSEIVLAIDDRYSWRKDIYPLYKGNRKEGRDKSEIDFEQYYPFLESIIEVINTSFPFKVVRSSKAEADDIIAVLAKNTTSKTLVLSEDKDFKQLLKYSHVSMYRPIQKEYVRLTKKELTNWRAQHILGGDSGDNVPTIKFETEFSPNFIKYLRENNIFETDVFNFNKLSISKKLYEEYNILDKKGEKDIFKPARFGEKGILDFTKNLKNNLKEKRIFWENYKRNRELVIFDKIPLNMQNSIIDSYNNSTILYNPLKIKSFFDTNELRYLSNNVQDFYNNENKITVHEGMFDWI